MQLRNWLKHKIKHPDLPYLAIIFSVFSVIVATNFPWGDRWMTGWDNLHPEFNFPLNFKRAFEGVWQANQGLGLVGGHGYAATLPHTLFLWLLSLVLSVNSLRPIFTFLMLFVGSLGAYYLTKHLVRLVSGNQQSASINQQIASLFSAIFAMLNIGTVQNFYIQLEAFIVHFAFLPWLILSLWRYLEHPEKKSFWQFTLVNIFILPAGFIPPLFVVQILLIILSLAAWMNHTFSKGKLKRAGIVVLTILCINAYWFLPFAYYTFTHSPNYLNAYNNLQSTQDFINKNQKYGDISDVALIRSFLFDANDVTRDGSLVKILAPWETHFNNPAVITIGYAVFVLSLAGAAYLITRKANRKNNIAIVTGYILIFLLLATGTPPFSWVTQWLRSHSPLFEQAFRVAFTKFSIAYGLHLTVLAGVGLYAVIVNINRSFVRTIISFSAVGMLIFYAWPAISGSFLYKTTKISIPKPYFELFDYMKTQPPEGRIMNLPQGWNWGWTLYKWGYSGSGFLWYGLEQPIMDRAFDVWSPYNENYYWELSHAIYAKNWEQFDAIVEKYHIQWILFDPSVIPVPGGKWIFYSQNLEDYLGSNPKYALVRQFDNLKLFTVQLENQPQGGVVAYEKLPNIIPTYKWSSIDGALSNTISYKSDAGSPADYFYPYRSLLTNRKVGEREFNIKRDVDGYILSPARKYTHSDYTSKTYWLDDFVPLKIRIKDSNENGITLGYSYIYPYTKTSFIPTESESRMIKIPVRPANIWLSVLDERITLYANGEPVQKEAIVPYFWKLDPQITVYGDNNSVIDYFNISRPEQINTPSTDDVYVPFVAGSLSYDSVLDENFLSHKKSDCIKVLNEDQPVIWDEGKKVLKFVSSHNDECFDIVLPRMRQDVSYIVEIESKVLAGKPLQFALVNKQVGKTDFELSLSNLGGYQTAYFIIPPMQSDGLGYSLHFTNKATGAGLSENLLKSVRVTPIPVAYLSSLNYKTASAPVQIRHNFQAKMATSHLYQIQPTDTFNQLEIVLSQAFDKGWTAFFLSNRFPFFTSINHHFLVNNWANGWKLEELQEASHVEGLNQGNEAANSQMNEATLVVFFLPQLLEYLGFILLPIPFLLPTLGVGLVGSQRTAASPSLPSETASPRGQ